MRSTSRAVHSLVILLALAGPLQAQPAPPPRAQPAPPPLAILDVPFISQSEALCGGAAAAMVLRYWGERGLTAESFAHLVDRSAAGIRTSALIGDLQRRGWEATGIAGVEAQIGRELERGRPVLALIEDRPRTFHYVVVVAATPTAIVFHDPARAPMRIMARAEFTDRWKAAGRWMAIVLPGARAAATPATVSDPPPATPCDALVAEGVAQAQADDLEASERSLVAALSCAGSAAMRELAGVRLLQRRWSDVEALAGAAVAEDPADAHAWRLLATSRFVQDNRRAALAAWNRVGEPRVDLVRIDGLTRTRQRPVERLIGASPGDLLTGARLTRAQRRLAELPSAAATRLEYVPAPSGLAELRATVTERPLAPADVWAYAALVFSAAARREVEYATGSVSGGGERLTGSWRFWPHRPGAAASIAAPAPWGGTWAVSGARERQPFDRPDLPDAVRTSADLRLSQWITPVAELAVRGGVERRERMHGVAGGALRLRSGGDRIEARLSGDLFVGGSTFSAATAVLAARSSAARRGRVYLSRAGAGLITKQGPLDAWLAGDTGDTRPIPLRAHPLVEDGALRSDRLGRRIVHASLEAQHWWTLSLARLGAAVFADAAHVGRRLESGGLGDADAGLGARLALPGLPGIVRADVARGLRDGATRWSFVYESAGW